MKQLLTAILLLSSVTFTSGQDKAVKKPEYVIIAGDKIITEATLEEYSNKGYLKAMHTGVSEARWQALRKKFGDKVGEDREFIITIELFTEKERQEQMALKAAAPPREEAPPKAASPDGVQVRLQAPDFTVTMTDGSRVQLSSLRGKVVLLNFWATWCGPCLMEFHEIPSKILQPFGDTDFVFLPVSIGEKQETVEKKMAQLAKKNIVFPAGFDTGLDIWKLYATDQSIPKNYLIDKNGIIRYVVTGYTKANLDNIKKQIELLLAE